MVSDGIGFVFASNLSSPSYFEINKTSTYDIDITYNQVVLSVGGINNYFNVNLYDITDSVIIGFCSVYINNQYSGGSVIANIKGLYTLQAAHSYDI